MWLWKVVGKPDVGNQLSGFIAITLGMSRVGIQVGELKEGS